MTRRECLEGAALLSATTILQTASSAAASLTMHEPLPRRVYQRTGYDPKRATDHQEGGPHLGASGVPIALSGAGDATRFEVRTVLLGKGEGRALEWSPITLVKKEDRWTGAVTAPAGGWYRLEVRAKAGDQVTATGIVEPVGVGEVFVVAGQSYAEGANDELLKVEDPDGRVSILDVKKHVWVPANDPLPNLGTGGTIWPPFADALLPFVHVPVGIVNVAVGGTASRQWLPGEALYENLARAGSETGRFRAVLWQQGESDVIENTALEVYLERIIRIRKSLAERWGFAPPWLPAKSTLHPTVYNDPVKESRIRAAIDQLWKTPGFRRGPDTDVLNGVNRGPVGTRQHFTGIGQRRAGLMWFAAVWDLLQSLETDGS